MIAEDLDPDPGEEREAEHGHERQRRREGQQTAAGSAARRVATSRIGCGRTAQQEQAAGDQAGRLGGEDQRPSRGAAECSFEIAGPSTFEAPCSTALTTPNWTTITQSQVREVNSRQPCAAREEVRAAPCRSARGTRIAAMSSAATPNEVARRSRAPSPGPIAATTRPPSARADDRREPLRPSRRSAFACCSFDSGDGLRDEPARGREEERELAPATRRERGHLPDLARARRTAGARSRPGSRPRRRSETTMTRWRGRRSAQIAADEQEEDLRNRAARPARAEVGLRAGQVEDRERERDGRERAAEERDRPRRGRAAGTRARASGRAYAAHASPSSASGRRTTARTASPARRAGLVRRRGRRGLVATNSSSVAPSRDAVGPLVAGGGASSLEVALDVLEDAEVDQREPLGRAPLDLVDRRAPRPRGRSPAAASAGSTNCARLDAHAGRVARVERPVAVEVADVVARVAGGREARRARARSSPTTRTFAPGTGASSPQSVSKSSP